MFCNLGVLTGLWDFAEVWVSLGFGLGLRQVLGLGSRAGVIVRVPGTSR